MRNATVWLFNIASQKPSHFPTIIYAECIAEFRIEIMQHFVVVWKVQNVVDPN